MKGPLGTGIDALVSPNVPGGKARRDRRGTSAGVGKAIS
jgi:hypothetical protein